MHNTRKRKYSAVEEKPYTKDVHISILNGKEFRISQNELYMVYNVSDKHSEKTVLYVKTKVDIMKLIKNKALKNQLGKVDRTDETYPIMPGYNRYMFNGEFGTYGTKIPRETDNDCLQMAESIASAKAGQTIYFYREDDPQLREIHSKELFGDSYNKNIKIAIDIKSRFPNSVNDFGNPEIGQVYAQVLAEYEHSDNKEHAPYHIATVILKDGDSNITLEANAGDKTLIRPTFDIYSTIPDSPYTFHKLDIGMFNATNPDNIITIVLESIHTSLSAPTKNRSISVRPRYSISPSPRKISNVSRKKYTTRSIKP